MVEAHIEKQQQDYLGVIASSFPHPAEFPWSQEQCVTLCLMRTNLFTKIVGSCDWVRIQSNSEREMGSQRSCKTRRRGTGPQFGIFSSLLVQRRVNHGHPYRL